MGISPGAGDATERLTLEAVCSTPSLQLPPTLALPPTLTGRPRWLRDGPISLFRPNARHRLLFPAAAFRPCAASGQGVKRRALGFRAAVDNRRSSRAHARVTGALFHPRGLPIPERTQIAPVDSAEAWRGTEGRATLPPLTSAAVTSCTRCRRLAHRAERHARSERAECARFVG